MKGVRFGDKHSFKDWGLITSARPYVAPPTAKTITVDIPSADGQIDLTETMTGEVKFKNRKFTSTFTVVDKRNRWTRIYSDILDYLHGQTMKIYLDEDPEYYYVGRLTVNQWKSSKVLAQIVIEGDVEPYKLERFSSLDEWEWDSFNFETGEIRYYKNLRVDESLDFVINGSRKTVIPKFHVTLDEGQNQMYLYVYHTKNGGTTIDTYTLHDGENRFVDLVMRHGDNKIQFGGYGTVSIEYQGGRL